MEIQIDRPATGTVGSRSTVTYVLASINSILADAWENIVRISKHEFLLQNLYQ